MTDKYQFKGNKNQIRIDSEWVQKILNDDAGAFESLFKRYCQPLINFALRYVRDIQVAENTVQDVFLKTWLNRKKLNPSLNIKSYLYISIKNQALKHIKHAQVKQRCTKDIRMFEGPVKTPEEKLNEKEIAVAVQRAIEALPTKCRIIFSMSKYDHLTYSEIAEIQSVSIKTVETHMGRALKFLRKRLSNYISMILL